MPSKSKGGKISYLVSPQTSNLFLLSLLHFFNPGKPRNPVLTTFTKFLRLSKPPDS